MYESKRGVEDLDIFYSSKFESNFGLGEAIIRLQCSVSFQK